MAAAAIRIASLSPINCLLPNDPLPWIRYPWINFLPILKLKKIIPAIPLNYRIDLEEFARFLGKTPVEAVEYPDLRRFLAQLKGRNLKPRTLARKLSSLRSFFKFLQREEVIQINPAKLLVTPKLDKPLPHFMSEEETVQLSRRLKAVKSIPYGIKPFLKSFIQPAYGSANWWA